MGENDTEGSEETNEEDAREEDTGGGIREDAHLQDAIRDTGEEEMADVREEDPGEGDEHLKEAIVNKNAIVGEYSETRGERGAERLAMDWGEDISWASNDQHTRAKAADLPETVVLATVVERPKKRKRFKSRGESCEKKPKTKKKKKKSKKSLNE